MSLPPREECAHQPFWCEENVWHLARAAQDAVEDAQVLFVTSRGDTAPFRHQRAAPTPGALIWWDYHVVLLGRREARWWIWDLDSTLPWPTAAEAWLRSTFALAPRMPPELRPLFRRMPAADYLRRFSSDRAHMRTPDGQWMQPPPPWPAILSGPSNLASLRDPDDAFFGPAVPLEQLLAGLEPGV